MTGIGLNLRRDSKRSLPGKSTLRSAILSRMGKMIRNEGTIRPRKNSGWPSDPLKPKKGPIFRVDDNSFPINLPPSNLSYNYYSNRTTATIKKGNGPSEKKSEIKKSLLNQLEKYCENTTLHGLRYVGDTQLSFGERIFWFISFSLAIGFAAYYISNIYTKWKSSPVIISFSPFDADLSSIPFPAVTICNMNQAKKSEAEKIIKEGSFIEKKLLDDSCNGNATFNSSEKIDWDSLRNFLIKVGNSCSDILKWCQWGSEIVNCADIFNNDLTDEGLCCSFNRLPPEKIFRNWKDISVLNQSYPSNVYDWDAERGFESDDGGDSIPRRPLGAGAHLGLSVVLDAQVDNYYCSSTRSTGFKIILSNPIETPKMADFGFLVSTGYETRIAIEPSVREATTSLRNVPIEKRQCYFANERPLKYYRSLRYNLVDSSFLTPLYTQPVIWALGETLHLVFYLAQYPAITNLQFQLFMKGNDTTDVCATNNRCTEKIMVLVDRSQGQNKNVHGESIQCNCLYLCFKIDYFFSITNSPLRLFRKTNFTENFVRDNLAKAVIFFESTSYSKIKKMPLYNFTDLMAYTGGLLGFFIGFSFLSVVEIFFHMIWLPWKEYSAVKTKEETDTPEENQDLPSSYSFVE